MLLINGIGAAMSTWQDLLPHLPDRQIHTVDLPGIGRSPVTARAWTMAHYAQLVTELLEELELPRVDVLGYSWGGALAQQLAHDAPQRVRALVLAATTAGLGAIPPWPWTLPVMCSPLRYHSPTFARLVEPVLYGAAPSGADERDGTPAGRALLRHACPPSTVGYLQQLAAIATWSSLGWAQRITAPTLILSGRDDMLCPPGNGQLLARMIPCAQLQILPAGHLLLHDQPQRTGAAISRFLSIHIS